MDDPIYQFHDRMSCAAPVRRQVFDDEPTAFTRIVPADVSKSMSFDLTQLSRGDLGVDLAEQFIITSGLSRMETDADIVEKISRSMDGDNGLIKALEDSSESPCHGISPAQKLANGFFSAFGPFKGFTTDDQLSTKLKLIGSAFDFMKSKLTSSDPKKNPLIRTAQSLKRITDRLTKEGYQYNVA